MPKNTLERSDAVFHPDYTEPVLRRSNAVFHPGYLRISPDEARRNLEASREFRFAVREMERRRDSASFSR